MTEWATEVHLELGPQDFVVTAEVWRFHLLKSFMFIIIHKERHHSFK